MRKIILIAIFFIGLPLLAAEPKWIKFPRVREPNNNVLWGKVLQDIDSHLEAGHHYSANNLVTFSHESSHGVHSKIRNQNFNPGKKINAFYCLEDRAVIIEEPKTKILRVADKVPEEFKGPSFNLYLVEQRRQWNNEPLYLLDEWTAYTNGVECGRELNYSGWYYELLQAHNFNVYCMYLAMVIKEDCKDYDDTVFKTYLMWNIERTFRLANGAPALSKPIFPQDKDPSKEAMDYVEKVRTSPKGEELRKFAREYFGKEWCKKVYGF